MVRGALDTTTLEALVRSVCDYGGPMGASGVFLVDRESAPPIVDFYSPDGLRSAPPAAGLRCVARYIADLQGTRSITFVSESEQISAEVMYSPDRSLVCVAVKSPPIDAKRLSAMVGSSSAEFWSVKRGSLRHVVGIVDDSDLDVRRLASSAGAMLRSDWDGVTFARSISGSDYEWVALSWDERGSQLVSSVEGAECVAAVVASSRAGAATFTIRMAGGPTEVLVELDGGSVKASSATGNATFVYTTDVNIDDVIYSPIISYGLDANIGEIDAFAQLYDSNRQEIESLGLVVTDEGLG